MATFQNRLQRALDLVTRNFPVVGYLVIASAVSAAWYRGTPLVWGDDAAFPFTTARASTYFHLLDAGIGGPDGRKFPFLLPLGALLKAWQLTRLPYNVTAIQPLIIAGLIAIGGAGMYALLRTLLPSIPRIACFGGGLVYGFNIYSMTTVWSAMAYLTIEYAWLPLVILLWVAALRKASAKRALLAALVWLLTLTPAYVTTPIAMTDSALFAAIALVVLAANHGFRLRTFGTGVLLYAAWLAGSLYWLIPLLKSVASVTATGVAAGDPTGLFSTNSARLVNALRLGGYWGITSDYAGYPYFAWKTYYEHVGLPVATAIPVVAVIGLIGGVAGARRFGLRLSRPEQVVMWFAFALAIATLFFITGTHAPLGQLKRTTVDDLHLEGPFRSVYQRFGMYLCLAYAPLVALGIAALRNFRIQSDRSRALAWLISCAAIVAVAVVPVWPMWTGTLLNSSGHNPSRRIDVPSDYGRVTKAIDSTPGDFDVLTLPFGGNLGVTSFAWNGVQADYPRPNPILGYHGIEPLQLMLKKGVVVNDPTAPYLFSWVERIAKGQTGTLDTLRLLNTGYIVLHLDENLPFLEGSGRWTGLAIRKVAGQLDQTHGVQLVYASYTLRVYRVVGWQPFRVYALRLRRSDGGVTPFNVRALKYHEDGYGKFVVDTRQLRPHELVVVNRPYDSRWRANGQPPVSVAPGLPAFRLNGSRQAIIEFGPERTVSHTLLALPGSLILILGSLLGLMWRSRRSGGHSR